MKMTLKQRSEAMTPGCGSHWQQASPADRLRVVRDIIDAVAEWASALDIAEVRDDGQVILRFTRPVDADRRGGLLLDLEDRLKSRIDQGLTVWLEPLGDRNSLRRLRGIEVRS
jgi:hypothetical protein